MALFALLLLLLPVLVQGELLVNGDFEDDFEGNWYCVGCTLEHSEDHNSGTLSGRVFDRTENWAGVSQLVQLEQGATYFFTSSVKILNQEADAMWHQVEAMLYVEYEDGGEDYFTFSALPQARVSQGYVSLTGDITLPDREISGTSRLYVQADPASVDYLLDTASLTQFNLSDDWREQANERIDTIRKNNINFRVSIGPEYEPSDVELRVEMLKHDFPFGSAVVADLISGTDERALKYQAYYYEHFNYAALEEALKWHNMEPNRGEINYDRPEMAVDALRSRGIPVRGHCVYWGVERNVPEWVKSLSPSEVRDAINTRADGVVARFEGKLTHWDVNNEQLHGTFFEESTGDADILLEMFNATRRNDPDVKLFTNDFNVVSTARLTAAMTNQAVWLSSSGAQIYGIGIQSHLNAVDIAAIRRRLEVVTSAGLPIWITELDVDREDLEERADGYEDVLRLYFSQATIEGVLLWGFWDQEHWRPNAALVEGDDLTPNAAGLRVASLLKEEWATNESLFPEDREEELTLRAFQGEYRLQVLVAGQEVTSETFYLPKGEDVTVDVDV